MDKQQPNPNVIPTDSPSHKTPRKKDKTGPARSKAYRERKKQQFHSATAAAAEPSSKKLVPPNAVSTHGATEEKLALAPAVTSRQSSERVLSRNTGIKQANSLSIAPSRQILASFMLTTAAVALSAVGIAVNGWFARSLGSSDLAGWLFLAVGVAADLAAFVLPYTAARLWHNGQQATAVVGWVVWFVTFVFAVTAGIGFASSNIADVTLIRASRVTPTVTSAQAMLADAMTARDRECKGGVGRFCREREALVAERRQLLDAAMRSVGKADDPQTDAAIKLIAWISGGIMRPGPEDFSMFRLSLFVLLPQIGGLLLLVGRSKYQLQPIQI